MAVIVSVGWVFVTSKCSPGRRVYAYPMPMDASARAQQNSRAKLDGAIVTDVVCMRRVEGHVIIMTTQSAVADDQQAGRRILM